MTLIADLMPLIANDEKTQIKDLINRAIRETYAEITRALERANTEAIEGIFKTRTRMEIMGAINTPPPELKLIDFKTILASKSHNFCQHPQVKQLAALQNQANLLFEQLSDNQLSVQEKQTLYKTQEKKSSLLQYTMSPQRAYHKLCRKNTGDNGKRSVNLLTIH